MSEKSFNYGVLEKVVSTRIERDKLLGEHTDGSGHKGHVEYRLDRINEPKWINNEYVEGWEISYEYTLIVTTEFTIYPDNPPYEYRKTKTIVLDDLYKQIVEILTPFLLDKCLEG